MSGGCEGLQKGSRPLKPANKKTDPPPPQKRTRSRADGFLSFLKSSCVLCFGGLSHGCCWETFYISAYCGLVGNSHLTAILFFLLPFQRQPSSTGVKFELLEPWLIIGEPITTNHPGSKKSTQNGTLVNGSKGYNLRNPGSFIFSHTHLCKLRQAEFPLRLRFRTTVSLSTPQNRVTQILLKPRYFVPTFAYFLDLLPFWRFLESFPLCAVNAVVNLTTLGLFMFVSQADRFLGVPSPFFLWIILSGNPPETQGERPVFGKNDG